MSLTAKEEQTLSRLLSHMAAVREHWSTVVYIKEALRDGDALKCVEAWTELDYETRKRLWVAPLNGGVWTTKERKLIREWEAQVVRPTPLIRPLLREVGKRLGVACQGEAGQGD